MSFANAMDDLIPSKLGAEEDATTVKRDWAVISAHFVSLFLWVLFAVHDIHRHKGGNDVDHARLGAASGKLGVTRFALGLGRLAVFAFAVFFVLYHLCYENVVHETDGMDYLSDWTFVLLGVVSGATAAYSLRPELFGSDRHAANLTAALYTVAWTSNTLSTAGAWYSFVFFPQCVALEGVDNYPWCYLEWYRLSEHGLNMLILFGEWSLGAVPFRGGDYGHTVVFIAVYAVWTWYLQLFLGKCPYVMFGFDAGWSSVAWLNAALVGVSGVFFSVKRMHDSRDAAGAAETRTLPTRVKYGTAEKTDGENADEYE